MHRLLPLLLLVAASIPHGARAQALATLPHAAAPRTAAFAAAERVGAVTFGRDPYRSAEVAVGADGGLHAAFVSLGTLADAAHKPVLYAYCPPGAPSGCAAPADWALVEVAAGMPFVQLALAPGGRPRLFLYDDRATVDGEPGTLYTYAECDAGCTSPAAWRVRTLGGSLDAGNVDSDRHPVHRFALDAAGRPRFVYYHGTRWLSDTAWEQPSYYAACDVDCAGDGAWSVARMPDALRLGFDQDLENAALAFSADGSARLLYTADLPHEGDAYDTRAWLVYAECAAPCAAEGDWSAPAPLLFLDHGTGDRSFSLAVDGEDRLHVAAKPIGASLLYAWCDGACTDPDRWQGYALGLDAGDGEHPALALDAAGRPRIAYRYEADGADGLGYAWCTGDCRGAAPAWERTLVEASDALFEAVPVALAPGCTDAYWQGALRPTLALDGAGDPLVGYDADYARRCYHDASRPELGSFVERTYWTSRFVFFPHPDGATTPTEPAPLAVAPTLGAAHPNPTHGPATLPLTLTAPAHVRVTAYDALGREVARLVDARLPAGVHPVAWDGSGLPSGVYLLRLEGGGGAETRRVTVVR